MTNRSSKFRKWILAITIILTILVPTFILTIKSQLVTTQTTTIYLNPSEIILNTTDASVGDRFNVTAMVSDVSDLFIFQVALYYNASVINMTSVRLPSDYVLAGRSGSAPAPSYDYFDSWGVAMIGFTCYAGQTPFSGDGKLVVFEFEIIATPPEGGSLTSDLIISYKPSGGRYESKLKNSAAQPITFTATDGRYEYVTPGFPPPPPEGTQLYIDPPEIVDPTLLPPATVRINVTINNVTNLYGYEFYLNYDTNILTCTSLTINSVLGEVHFTPKMSVDDETGTIYVKVSYYEPAEPIATYTPLALVTTTFIIDSLGSSTLDLNNTQLTDPSAQQIEHEAKDGFIMTLIRDLAVINVTLSENIVYQGWPVNITVTAKNEGYINETFKINVYYDDTLIENLTIANLAPDQETTKTVTWYTSTVEPYINHTIKAEIPTVPYEIDTTDNAFADGALMVKLNGDINGDQIVDIDDIMVVALAFGSYPGTPSWNPEADLSGDGIIDIDDAVLVAINYGKHYP